MTISEIEFYKLESCGLGVLLISCLHAPEQSWEARAQSLLDYHRGIGADCLYLIKPSKTWDFQVVASVRENCEELQLDGLRCVTTFLAANNLLRSNQKELTLELAGRGVKCTLTGEGKTARVELGACELDGAAEVAAKKKLTDTADELLAGAMLMKVSAPVCYWVLLVGPEAKVNCAEVVRQLQEKLDCNESFVVVQRVDDDCVRVCSYGKRGAELRVLSAAAAAAAVAGGVEARWCMRTTRVITDHAELQVEIQRESNKVIVGSTTRFVCHGLINTSYWSDS